MPETLTGAATRSPEAAQPGIGMPRVLVVIPGKAEGASMVFARRQAETVRALGAEVELFHLASRTSPAALLSEWARFRARLVEFRPDVVHAQFGTMTGFFSIVSAGKVPVLVTFRGSDLNPVPRARGVRAAVGRLLSQIAALRARRIVCVSEQVRSRLWWRSRRAQVLPTGVDLIEFQPGSRDAARQRLDWPLEPPVVLFNAGHDGPGGNKRLDLAEAAVAMARRRLPELRLEIMRGNVAPAMVPELMRAADCLLVTSDSEGSPNVVKEALATRLPVVSVVVGDVRERLATVAESRIVERDPEAICNALCQLLTPPRRCDSARSLETCSSDFIAQQLLEIYREMCGQGNAHPKYRWNTSHC